MRGIARVVVSGVIAFMVTAGCNKTAAPPPAVCSAPQGAAADTQALASSDTAFAVALFQPTVSAASAGASTGPNVILSPYSVSAVLKMVDVGAAGETDAQIQSVLHLSGNGATVAPAYAALACQDETDGSADGNDLSIANSVWGQQGTAFESSFTSALSSGYEAPLQKVDFETDPAAAASTINGWVSAETQGEIPTLLQPGDVDPHTRLVLVNAVYFKGTWATGFDASATGPQPFTLSDGSMASVPTMSGNVTAGMGSYQGASIVELPYKGGGLAMDFILPGGSLSALESGMTSDSLAATVASLAAPSTVSLYLPKFSFTSTFALVPVLQGLGMTDLFDPTVANLSGMDGAMDLYVKTVVQQALVEVDESGTVAAAATAASTDDAFVSSGPPPVYIDHPFLFLIRDTKNGSILFMGQVEDPRQGS
jgi:serpin B